MEDPGNTSNQSEGLKNTGGMHQGATQRATTSVPANAPEIKRPVRYRQSTVGLERDDWKVDKSAKLVTRTKAAEATYESALETYKASLSSDGIKLVEGLRESQIFTQWVKTFGQADARFPVLCSFMDVYKEKPTMKQRFLTWASSFRRCDPRVQILHFFNDVAQEGADNIWKVEDSQAYPKCFSIFNRASVFTVWRPTHLEAIRKMMLGQGVGKGLNIKGKSAKRGKLSGFVPFMQIWREEHKRLVRTLPRAGTVRIFFSTEKAREMVLNTLRPIAEEMMAAVAEAKAVIAHDSVATDAEDEKTAFQHLTWDMEDPNMYMVDDYAPQSFGLEVPERLFWEGYVMRQDCGRAEGCPYDTGRPSEPAFQDMNFAALRSPPDDGAPRAVLFQYAEQDFSMCPRNLLMAYEEQGRVMPVVSDFDCFLIGTRRVTYECNLSPDQLRLLKWCVDQIETILDKDSSDDTWTDHWLEVRKREAMKGFEPECPRFGYGDFKSYSIMQRACGRLQKSGCVRHGAECFNYCFPQELDEEFLVISDTLPGKAHWKYMKVNDLQDFLCSRIDDGFAMPLNPKWVLCDPGWKRVYDRLIASQKQNIQHSMDVWFPSESGVREKIEEIHAKHPKGFQTTLTKPVKRFHLLETKIGPEYSLTGTAAMDLGELEVKHHVKFHRAKRKLRRAVSIMNFQKEVAKTKEFRTQSLRPSTTRPSKTEPFKTETVPRGTQQGEAKQKLTAGLRAALFLVKLRRDISTGDTAVGSIGTSDAVDGRSDNTCTEGVENMSVAKIENPTSKTGTPVTCDESIGSAFSNENEEMPKQGAAMVEHTTSETDVLDRSREKETAQLPPLSEKMDDDVDKETL